VRNIIGNIVELFTFFLLFIFFIVFIIVYSGVSSKFVLFFLSCFIFAVLIFLFLVIIFKQLGDVIKRG
jgi:hypothetical protein